MNRINKQAGLLLDEPLIFERSRAGREGCAVTGGNHDPATLLPAELLREPIDGFPEVSEPEALAAARINAAVKKALEEVKRTAEKDENLVPPVFEAVKQYATVGEISNVLREVYGEYAGGKNYF